MVIVDYILQQHEPINVSRTCQWALAVMAPAAAVSGQMRNLKWAMSPIRARRVSQDCNSDRHSHMEYPLDADEEGSRCSNTRPYAEGVREFYSPFCLANGPILRDLRVILS